jgi:GNAT superfamily N-acetyltransferase
MSAFRIAPFTKSFEGQVLDLILPIQQLEFGVPITAADQPDLAKIPEVYQRGRGGFWVGLAGDELVGSIGLIDFGEGGALRKMFLRKDQRGSGLAQALLDTLMAHAASAGLPLVALGTLPRMRAAHRFYERNGFTRIGPETLPPTFPRMAVDSVFYRRDL